MPRRVWKDEMYLKTYLLARSGLRDPKIASALGVSICIFKKWKVKRPALVDAIQQARRLNKESLTESFQDYVYKRLPPRLQKVWERINAIEFETNHVRRAEALLEDGGKNTRQHLFLYALCCSNFNASEACRKVGVRRKTYEYWKLDPDFATLIDEMMWHKKNFVEGSLMELVDRGDTAAVIFANKALNRDRGYDITTKIDVRHMGQVDHVHAVVDISTLPISLEAKKEVLAALRAQSQPAIDVEHTEAEEDTWTEDE
jgi:hypothetical protein